MILSDRAKVARELILSERPAARKLLDLLALSHASWARARTDALRSMCPSSLPPAAEPMVLPMPGHAPGSMLGAPILIADQPA